MNKKIYSFILASVLIAVVSCKDESLYPLPYNDRTTGAYLRIYKQTSNVFDINDLNNSAFDVVFEPVDENNGEDLASVDFFASHRRGTDLTPEVLVTSIDASIFQPVLEPTYSVYKRGSVRITATEVLNALQTITAEPDGLGLDTNGDGKPGDECPLCIPLKGLAPFVRDANAVYTGTAVNSAPGNFIAGDQINIRYEMVMKDGRRFSVSNPQSTVNPAFANNATANSTPNITTGQFYASPFVVIMTVRSLITGSWTGTYRLRQRAIWSPSHNLVLHASAYPADLEEVIFPDQDVTLSAASGGLSTEREFTVTHRGATSTMRINFEQTAPLGTTANATATATIANTLIPFGFPASTAFSNLGTVFVPLINTTLDCTAEREIYWVTPNSGTFGNASSAANPTASNFLSGKPLLPQNLIPSRGVYRTDLNGLTPGDTFSISVDDDCDEYGRRNGYCTWTRTVYLTLTKL